MLPNGLTDWHRPDILGLRSVLDRDARSTLFEAGLGGPIVAFHRADRGIVRRATPLAQLFYRSLTSLLIKRLIEGFLFFWGAIGICVAGSPASFISLHEGIRKSAFLRSTFWQDPQGSRTLRGRPLSSMLPFF